MFLPMQQPRLLLGVVIDEFPRRQLGATMDSQRDVEDRGRRSEDHNTLCVRLR
jgi:hypothetical protein